MARRIAEELASRFGGVVVVTAGIHEEGLDRDGVAAWLRLAGELSLRLGQELESSGG